MPQVTFMGNLDKVRSTYWSKRLKTGQALPVYLVRTVWSIDQPGIMNGLTVQQQQHNTIISLYYYYYSSQWFLSIIIVIVSSIIYFPLKYSIFEYLDRPARVISHTNKVTVYVLNNWVFSLFFPRLSSTQFLTTYSVCVVLHSKLTVYVLKIWLPKARV